MSELITVQSEDENIPWSPVIGEEVNELLISKGFSDPASGLSHGGERILDETSRIMEKCGDPLAASNSETGLVLGYVQSGKTMSFTSLTALARDNEYQIVIVIAGISTSLFNQSTVRLRRDLRLETRDDRKWILLPNAGSYEDRQAIERALVQWADPTYPNNRCRTILITVMKNGARLQNLIDILSALDLSTVPVLIIDDEGDQASLNTKARRAARLELEIESLSEEDVSTIYRRITRLRSICPNHTFLQYTATPQANLFINIMDRLSPNFIKLLTPGPEYTGGIQFFRENDNLIKTIPPSEIPSADVSVHEPPDSLLDALRIFYLGVASGETRGGRGNRSMLIHPSRLQDDHTRMYGWVAAIKQSWTRLLTGTDEDEKEALLREFRRSYDDLVPTVADLEPFEQLTGQTLVHAIQYTPVIEVNARTGQTPQINWLDQYSWILVGGQAMDRGFTVEGLTVTYMPRNLGVGNVDTIQQRARFFGYKRAYLGFCRVYLDQHAIDAYNSIIDHEEDVRNRLLEFDVEDKHLNAWDRRSVLDRMLNLTRANVLFDKNERDTFGDEWIRIRAPHDTDGLISDNRSAVRDFLTARANAFNPDTGHQQRTEDQKHLVASLTLSECLDSLLNNLRFTRESDSNEYSSLRGIIKRYIDKHGDEECVVYLMSATSIDGWTARTRRLNANDEIQQLFQGRNPRTGEVIYPGDAEVKNEDKLTIQLHRLDLRDTEYVDVLTAAFWVPEHIAVDIIRQA